MTHMVAHAFPSVPLPILGIAEGQYMYMPEKHWSAHCLPSGRPQQALLRATA